MNLKEFFKMAIAKVFLFLILIFSFALILGCNKVINETPPKMIASPHFTMYGTLTDFQPEQNFIKFSIDQEIYNCEKNKSSITISSTIQQYSLQENELIKGKKYFFNFNKINESSEWILYINKDSVDSADVVKNICAIYHDSDLMIDLKTKILPNKNVTVSEPGQEGRQFAIQIISEEIKIEQPSQISVDLINKQDVPINYNLLEFSIVDEIAAEPFKSWWEEPKYEERLKNSKISECNIDYNKQEQTIPANSTQTLTFTVTCSEPKTCKKSYESCDIKRQNCKTQTLDKCKFYLWGEISFEDELGIKHIIPKENGIIKQFIEIQ